MKVTGKEHFNFKDLSNKRFGKLLVTDEYKGIYKSQHAWKCICDCENETWVVGASLTRGLTTSCGCVRKETNKQRALDNRETRDAEDITIYNVYAAVRKKAENRNLNFELTFEQFKEITRRDCTYCGKPASESNFLKDKLTDTLVRYNGVDRANNNEGYTLSNSVPCCKMCNWMKMNLTVDEWITHMKQIINYLESEV